MNKYKHLRTILALSQSEMARILGLSRGAYAMVETGKRKASDDVEFRYNAINTLTLDNILLIHYLDDIKRTPWWKKPFIKIDLTNDKKNVCGSVKK